MSKIIWTEDVRYQKNGFASGAPLEPDSPTTPSGNSFLWQGERGVWSTNHPSREIAFRWVNQITFPDGIEITALKQQITIPIWISDRKTTMVVEYSGHFTPQFPNEDMGEAIGFKIISLKKGQYTHPLAQKLVGAVFVVSTGETSLLSRGTLIPEVPDLIITCFLAGACVEMADGSFKTIEDIIVGDHVKTFPKPNELASATVCAVHKRTILATHRDLLPVVIRENALGEGIPSRDLALTGDHCLWFHGYFVPARMLVNNRSIYVDEHYKDFIVYNIETENHEIINVDGVRTETLLKTTRGISERDNIIEIKGAKNWLQHAAAPLKIDRTFVEPLFHTFAIRAEQAGVPDISTPVTLTNDAGLRVVTNTGHTIRPARINRGNAVFMLPRHVRHVWLRSRTSRPCDVVGPFLDDRRELGILVGNIDIIEAGVTRKVTSHLTLNHPQGWSLKESSECRWTTGNASVDLSHTNADIERLMCIQILSGGPYQCASARQEELSTTNLEMLHAM